MTAGSVKELQLPCFSVGYRAVVYGLFRWMCEHCQVTVGLVLHSNLAAVEQLCRGVDLLQAWLYGGSISIMPPWYIMIHST